MSLCPAHSVKRESERESACVSEWSQLHYAQWTAREDHLLVDSRSKHVDGGEKQQQISSSRSAGGQPHSGILPSLIVGCLHHIGYQWLGCKQTQSTSSCRDTNEKREWNHSRRKKRVSLRTRGQRTLTC
ncbi:hypothetical protein DNTS_015603 [Danionella cerebrum]|uniref:Uncharacterized protein n=1 Tax=Danionella cerebrum TaxID=2873325 RepID=A0A553QS96_9TELE|nr:hypothetical protein DNTS_015603 [Danionella translucida]